jgi:glycosyltransferase involved in cell wall biosynthesis
MRARENGVVRGDRLQIEFSPYVTHSVFQSEYSRSVFLEAGFAGDHTVIHNGVDEDVFNLSQSRFLRRSRLRDFWDGREPLRLVVSTWSTDENKGFPEYRRIDEELAGRTDVRIALVGRVPEGVGFRTFKVLPARPASALARVLRESHVLLQLARYETGSNALIEGINCGLPVIYLDSGSNAEIAADYGVEYRGDIAVALDAMRDRYRDVVGRIPSNPYRVRLVVDRYLELFERVRA